MQHPWANERGRVPDGHWESRQNRVNYLQWLGDQLGFEKTEDWYSIRFSDFANFGGRTLYQHIYQQDRSKMLGELFPEAEFHPWLFQRMPINTWNNMENRVAYFDWIADKEGFTTKEDWYSMKRTDFEKYPGGSMLNNLYGGSPREAIMDIYPDYEWKEWMFFHAPPGFWDDDDKVRPYLEWLGRTLGYSKPEDWYNLHLKMGEGLYISGLNRRFDGSAFRLCKHFFPEFDWKPWLFHRVGNTFWKDRENRRSFMAWLQDVLELNDEEEWYSVTKDDFEINGGLGLLSGHYDYSPASAIMDLVDAQEWLPWKFTITPRGYMDSWENRRRYADWLFEKLGFERTDDWYSVSQNGFEENHGGGFLLHRYGGSPIDAIVDLYPDEEWLPWKFKTTKMGFWKEESNRSLYMDWLEEELGIDGPSDWYKKGINDIQENYGHGILAIHDGSLVSILKEYYTEFDFHEWKFGSAPNNFWKKRTNRVRYLEWLESELDISEKDDWYTVDKITIMQNHGNGILSHWGSSKIRMLEDAYPGHDWDHGRLKKIGKNQQRLTEIVQSLFPDDSVLVEFKHEEMRFTDSNRKMELDIFIPERKIAFEYQGEQHFEESWMDSREDSLQRQEKRDEEKRIACKELGISLIEIPYTWNRKEGYVQGILSEMDIEWGGH